MDLRSGPRLSSVRPPDPLRRLLLALLALPREQRSLKVHFSNSRSLIEDRELASQSQTRASSTTHPARTSSSHRPLDIPSQLRCSGNGP